MKRAMETVQDLIEEAKVRTVCWAICVFAISYFLTHTSKSMWMNIPISILLLAVFRYLSYEVELRWRVRPTPKPTYLSHLRSKELTLDDFRVPLAPPLGWRSKIDSPTVEAAIEGFIDKILQDFVVDLWYSSITPDKEAPELIRAIILNVLGEISARVKEINLVDLLTRDLVDLIGNQIDLYRKNQSEIGAEIMATLSFEERDEKLKQHLMAAKELHPALHSPESEYKVLQRIVGGILTIVLKPQEAQCPLVHCIGRELLTCLVLQPVMSFASPRYINELIEYVLLNNKDSSSVEIDSNKSSQPAKSVQNNQKSLHDSQVISANTSRDLVLVKDATRNSLGDLEHCHLKTLQKDTVQHAPGKPADWAVGLDAATKRRTQVLAPENLENMWTKGRHYQKKTANLIKAGTSPGIIKDLDSADNYVHEGSLRKESVTNLSESIKGIDEKYMVHLMQASVHNEGTVSLDMVEQRKGKAHFGNEYEDNARETGKPDKVQLREPYSIPPIDAAHLAEGGESTRLKENDGPNHNQRKKEQSSHLVSHGEGSLLIPKIRCRIVGAYFEKLGSKSFAVYSIAVTDAESKAWFVKRRYRNFERLHRQLKDIPNYSLHLPPKRFLSSSIDDYFVHQRCIHLDKYLQDLLSIPNVAEQHEVWDFLSLSSKNYSFGKSPSVIKTLAVNVDDAVDDIFRQFKGVSDGFRKVISPSLSNLTSSSLAEKNLSLTWNVEDMNKQILSFSNVGSNHSKSDDDDHDDGQSNTANNGWHSDNELKSKRFLPRYVKHNEESSTLASQSSIQSDKSGRISFDGSKASVSVLSDSSEDPDGMPPEWAPTNVSVPMLNLVDKIFQLNGRGWIRKQVYWIAKQILQLMMEDAIDDWILRQIYLLRREDVIARGIRWVQDILWPNGTFFMRLESSEGKLDNNKGSSQTTSRMGGTVLKASSFELQLEAARRASDVKKMILGGAPSTLVSLIGPSQYKRSAKDVYYFLQSNICVKQLAYNILEMVLSSVFPELRSLILDIHENAHNGT